jgi:hypothetical protein
LNSEFTGAAEVLELERPFRVELRVVEFEHALITASYRIPFRVIFLKILMIGYVQLNNTNLNHE